VKIRNVTRSRSRQLACLTVLLCPGVISSMAQAAVHYQVLKSFGFPLAEYPEAPLVRGKDGALYGTASMGGAGYVGTVFRLNGDGGGYRVLDLTNWTPLATVRMPSAGVYTNIDKAPPTNRAYYRAVWLPQ